MVIDKFLTMQHKRKKKKISAKGKNENFYRYDVREEKKIGEKSTLNPRESF